MIWIAQGLVVGPWWAVLLDALLTLSVPTAIAVLTVLLVKLLTVLRIKTHAELGGKDEEAVDTIVRRAVGFAEEQARKALKAIVDGSAVAVPLSGEQKLAMAISAATDWLQTRGFPELLAGDIESRIEAALQSERKWDAP